MSAFLDDFSDGIWKKHPGNPVLVRSQPWAESDYICEPNILYRDGLFHNWFSQMFPAGSRKTGLGYATSPDGFTWTKYPGNPVLADGEVHRPYVMEHDGMFCVFAVQNEYQLKAPSTMRRWVSGDGVNWRDGRLVMTADQPWEGGLSNMSVIVDDDGLWRMLYTGSENDEKPYPEFGYAWSRDGVTWTKYDRNPVIAGFYAGDPFLVKIGERYYAWHSQSMSGSLRIACRWSPDMIHWHSAGRNPQINYTQTWERGVPAEEGGTTRGWYGHLTDATLCEVQGRVFMVYQGAQTPLGIATFDGALADLAQRLQTPPLSKWNESPFGMVDDGMLKLADNGSDRLPLAARIGDLRDRYLLECRVQCYAGPTSRVSVVMRYGDQNNFARLWLHDAEHTFYQECIRGLFGPPVNIGPNPACDSSWHDWRIQVDGETNRLHIDKRLVGECRTTGALQAELSSLPAHVGFSAHDTWAAVDYVRVDALNE